MTRFTKLGTHIIWTWHCTVVDELPWQPNTMKCFSWETYVRNEVEAPACGSGRMVDSATGRGLCFFPSHQFHTQQVTERLAANPSSPPSIYRSPRPQSTILHCSYAFLILLPAIKTTPAREVNNPHSHFWISCLVLLACAEVVEILHRPWRF